MTVLRHVSFSPTTGSTPTTTRNCGVPESSWVVDGGTIVIPIGSSSRDIRVRESVRVSGGD